jgi:hypothetical protein
MKFDLAAGLFLNAWSENSSYNSDYFSVEAEDPLAFINH